MAQYFTSETAFVPFAQLGIHREEKALVTLLIRQGLEYTRLLDDDYDLLAASSDESSVGTLRSNWLRQDDNCNNDESQHTTMLPPEAMVWLDASWLLNDDPLCDDEYLLRDQDGNLRTTSYCPLCKFFFGANMDDSVIRNL